VTNPVGIEEMPDLKSGGERKNFQIMLEQLKKGRNRLAYRSKQK